MELDENKIICVGALGEVEFDKGIYIYAGSALSSLKARVGRHFSKKKNLHWHIDYFLKEARPIEALIIRGNERMECLLNEMVSNLWGTQPSYPGFGSSDCSCLTHLHKAGVVNVKSLELFLPEKITTHDIFLKQENFI
ncbi:MAG: GIY-YIG nuclease family protein [Methanomassiliicoccales archaeon]